MVNVVVFFVVSSDLSYLGQDGMVTWISESAGAFKEVYRIRVGKVSHFNTHAF